MAERIISTKQKLAVIEALCEEYRSARNDFGSPEHQALLVLRSVADDLRGRLPETRNTVLRNLEKEVTAAKNGKLSDGYQPGHLRAVAEVVLGSMSTIRFALDKFKGEP
jgi:hypothetical protein